MKNIFNFYIRAFFTISFISIPFIFISFSDLNKNELTYKVWISSFFPQLIYILYLFKKNRLFVYFKANLLSKHLNLKIILFCFFMPFLIFTLLVTLKLINVYSFFNWNLNIFFYFILIFLSALSEEILFRFIPFRLLGDTITLKKIVLISLFFSLFHFFNPNFNIIGIINIVIVSVFYSLIYLKTNSILLVTVLHALWNFTIGCILGSNISGIKIISFLKYLPQKPLVLSGGEFGFEGSIITSIILLIYLLVFCKYYNIKNNQITLYNPLFN